MTTTINPDVVAVMTNEELDAAIKVYQSEINYRKEQRRANAIENFHSAFNELEKLGIDVGYIGEDYEIGGMLWNDFTFD